MSPAPEDGNECVRLEHGAGGRAMRRLIEETFHAAFTFEPELQPGVIGLSAMDDGAAIRVGDQWLVMTTDSHVMSRLCPE